MHFACFSHRLILVLLPSHQQVIQEGNFELVELRDSEGHLTRKLIERLFTSLGRANAMGAAMIESADTLMDCWRVAQAYRANARAVGRIGRAMQWLIFGLSVLVTSARR